MLRNSRPATAHSTFFNEAAFRAQFAGIFVNDLWRDSLNVLPKKDVDSHVEENTCTEATDNKGALPDNGSGSESGYNGLTHEDACKMVEVSTKEHERKQLECFIDNSRKQVVLTLFEKAQKRA